MAMITQKQKITPLLKPSLDPGHHGVRGRAGTGRNGYKTALDVPADFLTGITNSQGLEH